MLLLLVLLLLSDNGHHAPMLKTINEIRLHTFKMYASLTAQVSHQTHLIPLEAKFTHLYTYELLKQLH